VNTLRLSAALAALTLTASTTCAAVIDLGDGLGPSGRYTSQAHYQVMLGSQPMTAAQQAYSDQEDQLRQMGFLSELGGDIALGQIFYHMAYGIAAPSSASGSASGGSDLDRSFLTPSGPVTGASDVGSTGAAATDGSYGSVLTDGSVLTMFNNTGADLVGFAVIAIPEPATWAMMAIGFAGLGFMGWRSRKTAAAA
jgi:hypothetical protein